MTHGRFTGADGPRLVAEALRQQSSLLCEEGLIEKLRLVVKIDEYNPGQQLIIQGSDDNRIAFILAGRVSIQVNGHAVAERRAGQHVGEMAVIDPSARRSATVIALEACTVAWADEREFVPLIDNYPGVWRQLARELGERLRQRGSSIRMPNERPIIFIGSSSESKGIVKSVDHLLSVDPVVIRPWNRGVFGASEVTIESLEEVSRQSDFAVLVLTADDVLRSRGRQAEIPRDNVVFELGLFIGVLGRKRTFILVEEGKKLRLPPDLEGVTNLRFSRADQAARRRTLKSAADQIRARIAELGPKRN